LTLDALRRYARRVSGETNGRFGASDTMGAGCAAQPVEDRARAEGLRFSSWCEATIFIRHIVIVKDSARRSVISG
ncbi:MAG: hypothetical protein WBD73_00245, partial [Candidatus Acidiferrales bacterium]